MKATFTIKLLYKKKQNVSFFSLKSFPQFKSQSYITKHVLNKDSQLVESQDGNCSKLDASPHPIMSSK